MVVVFSWIHELMAREYLPAPAISVIFPMCFSTVFSLIPSSFAIPLLVKGIRLKTSRSLGVSSERFKEGESWGRIDEGIK